MSFADLQADAVGEVRGQLAAGTLKVWPRRQSVRRPGVGLGDQAEGEAVEVRATRQPTASYGIRAGAADAEAITMAYGVRESDLAGMLVGEGTLVEYTRDLATGETGPARVERGAVESIETSMGGRWIKLTVAIDRGSYENA